MPGSGGELDPVHRRIRAPRGRVYRALLDARAVATWMMPDGMTAHVHELDPREGGTDVVGVHDCLPRGVSSADNELGWRMALGKLAAPVERP